MVKPRCVSTSVSSGPAPLLTPKKYWSLAPTVWFFSPSRRRELVMYARTCFASDLIGCGLSVPPPRPACALALAEMPGRSRCTERILGCLGPGRLGKLLWGSGSREAAGEEAAWRGSTPSGGLRRPKSQGVEESCGGSGRALLISGAHWEQRSRRPRLQPVGWHSMSLCGPSKTVQAGGERM